MSFIDEKKIEDLLKELRALHAPDHSILRAKNIVMHAVRGGQGSRPLFQKRSFINSLLPQLRFKPMITFSLIVALLLGGGGTVAAAQNDLPGDTLYPIKVASEGIVETLALTSNAKVKVQAKLAERRVNEVIALKTRADAQARVADESVDEPKKEPSEEMKRHIEKATQRLEARIEKTKVHVEALKAHDTKGTLNAAAVLQAKIERMEAALEKNPENRSSRGERKSQEGVTIELDGGGAVEIELEVPEIDLKNRSSNLLKRKRE